MNSPFKPGDVVIIAPNDAPGDCCQGKQGRIMQGYKRGGWLIQTDHFCSIPRQEADLSLVPPEELARQYFDIEGWDVYEHYLAALKSNGLTIAEIQTAAQHGNPNCRHFLALYLAQVTEASEIPFDGRPMNGDKSSEVARPRLMLER